MASRLLRNGGYLTAVSKRLGHATPTITLNTYSHAIPSDQETLAGAFDAYLGKITASVTAASRKAA